MCLFNNVSVLKSIPTLIHTTVQDKPMVSSEECKVEIPLGSGEDNC